MRKLIVFNQVSVDGYFAGPGGDISWAHRPARDAEFKAFVEANAKGGEVLVFGRVTYELMARFWPTPQASAHDPVVAAGMNGLRKIVFSRTLTEAAWSNTKLVKRGLLAEIRRLKSEPGKQLTILGSGSLVMQLTQAELIDEYQIMIVPIVLGQGRTLFDGIKRQRPLKLVTTRAFANGNVLLSYRPEA